MPDNKGSVLCIDYDFRKTNCTFLGKTTVRQTTTVNYASQIKT